MTEKICEATTAARSVYNVNYRGNAGGQCKRRASYTDGEHFYCKQHAKEAPTMLRKASGRIRAELRPISNGVGKR